MAPFSMLTEMKADKAKDTSSKALDAAQSTYKDVQKRVQRGRVLALEMLVGGAELLQSLLQRRKRQTQKKMWWARKKARKNLGGIQNNALATWEKTQDVLQSGMDTAQNVLQASLDTAQDMMARNTKMAQKNLNNAQKNFRDMQGTVQKNVTMNLAKTQDLLGKSSKEASQRIQKAAASAQDMTGNVQDRYSRYVQKRNRARTFFRWGLVFGVVLALLYTPIAGPEIRQRLAMQWQQFRSYFGA